MRSTIALGSVALLLAASVTYLSLNPIAPLPARAAGPAGSSSTTPTINTPLATGPAAARLRRLTGRLGFEPAALAAAGVTPQNVAALLTDCRDALTPLLDQLDTADANVSVLSTQLKALKARITKEGTSPDKQATLTQLSAAVAQNIAARDALLESAFSAATAHLDPAVAATLHRIKANSARHRVPLYYLVIDRTSEQWLALEHNLTLDRLSHVPATSISPRFSSPPAPALLDNDPAIAAAKARMETNASTLATVLNTALPPTSTRAATP